jgi:copper chaperone CopZ/cbb3-type cytochrome oxidase subunit 3
MENVELMVANSTTGMVMTTEMDMSTTDDMNSIMGPMTFYWGSSVHVFFKFWAVKTWWQLILSGFFVALLAIAYEFIASKKRKLTERLTLLVQEEDDLLGENILTLNITGMTCQNCANTIENALKNQAGVKDAIVNFASKKAKVSFDSNEIDASKVISEVSEVGYSATESEPTNVEDAIKMELKFPVLQQTLLHAIYLILTYLLMFVVMTYNVGLILFLLVGFAVGVFFFR